MQGKKQMKKKKKRENEMEKKGEKQNRASLHSLFPSLDKKEKTAKVKKKVKGEISRMCDLYKKKKRIRCPCWKKRLYTRRKKK